MSAPNEGFFVSRGVREIPRIQDEFNLESEKQLLEQFRQSSAWVLLGEPGAGKTEALKQESFNSGGKYIRIAEFIDADIEPDWQGKTLFLDGLDEVRASGDALSAIQKIRKQLKRLDCPSFRISCRAADWHEATDTQDLAHVSPDKKIVQLQLVALDEEDISNILTQKYGVSDSQKFIDESKARGVFELLKNPQTLGLMVDATVDGKLPETRAETFRLACEKQLEDPNPRYSYLNRHNQSSIKSLLDTAGQLSAILLLSNCLGVALDRHRVSEHFLFPNDLEATDLPLLNKVVQSRLFLMDSQDRFVPSHRTIAEYLAACWLAQQLDTNRLPRQRLLNLLLGSDGGVVSGLRGLYAWLSVYSNTARTYLIDVDPLAIIIYGDPSLLPLEGKRQLLRALHSEAKKFSGFHWDARERHTFGALAVPELKSEFLAILQSNDRSEDVQSLVACVLDILFFGEPLVELAEDVFALINDISYWPIVRRSALKVWIKLPIEPQKKIDFLNGINTRAVIDDDDEFAGLLLTALYPGVIEPQKLINYFHVPTRENHTGSFVTFWSYRLAKIAPDKHISVLLDSLSTISPFPIKKHTHYSMAGMVDSLLVRAFQLYGDEIGDERLFNWLGIGADEYGNVRRDNKALEVVSPWFMARPDKYKKILELCFQYAERDSDPSRCFFKLRFRLNRIAIPVDLGCWHLIQAALCSNTALAKLHLRECINALSYQHGSAGLSLEMIEAWALDNPDKRAMLNDFLVCDIPSWRIEEAQRSVDYQHQLIEEKRERTVNVSPYLIALRTTEAHVGFLNELAHLWEGNFTDIPGESVEDRFANYSESPDEILAAAKKGFCLCPERNDLPSVEEIISLNSKNREHLIRLPCLIGMELRWQKGSQEIDGLPDDSLRKIIAFHLTYVFNVDVKWFLYLVEKKPQLVADVYIHYVKTSLKSGSVNVTNVYPFAYDIRFKPLVEIVVPELLMGFPLRTKIDQLDILGAFFKAALAYMPKETLLPIVNKKLWLKGIDSAQKVYWYAVAMLLDSASYENQLWSYIGKSEVKISHLTAFLENRYENVIGHYELSIRTKGKLIEFLTPHAEVDWGRGGLTTSARRRGDQIRGWINQLGASSKPEAAQELERLLSLPQLQKIFDMLKRARHEQKIKQRESEFSFHTPLQVEKILTNREPTDISDLTALVLDVLDDITNEIRASNANIMKIFWKENKNSDYSNQKDENDCRDALLVILRQRLISLGIDDVPEAHYFNQKRSDIRLSYGANMALPIEIKCDSHRALWTAWKTQLIEKYSSDVKANGFGVYLILWFGDQKGMPNPTDKGKKPNSAKELQARLEAQLDPLERKRIFIRVLDVSWP